jgi:hypothetical protein
VEATRVVNTTVQYRQLINGLPVISPDAGTVRVSVDNDGTVNQVHSSIRTVEQLTDRPVRTSAMPPEPQGRAGHRACDPGDYEQALAAEFGKKLSQWAIRGGVPLGFSTLPNSTEIGYDIQGDEATLVARKAVEVDFGGGFRKRYWVTVPLAG